MRDIDQVAILSRDLNSCILLVQGPLIHIIENLCDVSRRYFIPESVNECLREAARRLDSHRFPFALAYYHYRRFAETFLVDDYKEARALLDKIIASHSRGECSEPCAEETSRLVVELAVVQVITRGKPEDGEGAIDCCRTFLSMAPTDHPYYSTAYHFLAHLLEQRSRHFGVTEGLQEAHLMDPEDIHLPPFLHLTASLAECSSDRPRTMTPEEESQHTLALVSVCGTTDIMDL